MISSENIQQLGDHLRDLLFTVGNLAALPDGVLGVMFVGADAAYNPTFAEPVNPGADTPQEHVKPPEYLLRKDNPLVLALESSQSSGDPWLCYLDRRFAHATKYDPTQINNIWDHLTFLFSPESYDSQMIPDPILIYRCYLREGGSILYYIPQCQTPALDAWERISNSAVRQIISRIKRQTIRVFGGDLTDLLLRCLPAGPDKDEQVWDELCQARESLKRRDAIIRGSSLGLRFTPSEGLQIVVRRDGAAPYVVTRIDPIRWKGKKPDLTVPCPRWVRLERGRAHDRHFILAVLALRSWLAGKPNSEFTPSMTIEDLAWAVSRPTAEQLLLRPEAVNTNLQVNPSLVSKRQKLIAAKRRQVRRVYEVLLRGEDSTGADLESVKSVIGMNDFGGDGLVVTEGQARLQWDVIDESFGMAVKKMKPGEWPRELIRFAINPGSFEPLPGSRFEHDEDEV